MRFEQLFAIIHQLSTRQRSNFSRFTATKQDSLPLRLYRRTLQEKQLSKESLQRIKGSDFKHSSIFGNNRKILLQLLVESISHYEYGEISPLAKVKALLHIGAGEQAVSAIRDEMNTAYRKGRIADVGRMIDFISELSLLKGYEADFPNQIEFENQGLETQIVTFETALQHLEDFRFLNEAIVELKEAVKSNQEAKLAAVRKHGTIDEKDYDYALNAALALMVRVRVNYLLDRPFAALELGETLIDYLEDAPFSGPVFYQKELRLLASIAVTIFDRETASKHYFRIAKIAPENRQTEAVIRESRVFIGATIAAVFTESSIAESCYQELCNGTDGFRKSSLLLSWFKVGMAFFYHAEYEKAIACMNECRSIGNEAFGKLRWEPAAILAIAHHELGHEDKAESATRSAIRYAKSTGLAFPALAASFVRKYRVDAIENNRLVCTRFLHEIDQLMDDPNEFRAASDFPISHWIKSLMQKRIPADIVREDAEMQRRELFAEWNLMQRDSI